MNFLDGVSKDIQISNFMKIRPVIAELFHADGRTDGHYEASGRFSHFANAPKNVKKQDVYVDLINLAQH